MNIVIITPQLPPLHGGVGTTIKQIINSVLRHKGYKITILIPTPKIKYKNKILDNLKREIETFKTTLSIQFLPSKPIPRLLNNIVGKEFDKMAGFLYHHKKSPIIQYLNLISPDIICVFDPMALGGIPYLFGYGKAIGKEYAHNNRIPYIAYYNSHYIGALHYYPFYIKLTFKFLIKFLTKKYLQPFDQVIVFSHYIENELNKIKIQNTSVLTIEGPNSKLLPDIIDKYNEEFEKTTIIFTGRLMKEKNIDLMINIFIKLNEKNPNFRVIIIGEGPEKRKLMRLKGKIDIELYDWIETEELYYYLAKSNIFINCTSFETACISLAEAMYYKCVPVAYFKGGHTMFVTNYVNGFLCKNEDDYVKKVDFLISNPKYMFDMGYKAHEQIMKLFDSNTNVQYFLTFLNTIKYFS